jgi:aminopeptidase N
MNRPGLFALAFVAAAGCGDNLGGRSPSDPTPDAGGPVAPSEDFNRDLVNTDLSLDLTALTGRAVVEVAASDSTGFSLEIGDLEIDAVTDADGGALEYTAVDGQLDVGVPSGQTVVAIDYRFLVHPEFDGWMPDQGVTFLWPYFCKNLFPCKSDPSDGLTFTMEVVSEGTAVYPASIPADAPSYMPAVAVGDFREIDLGTTSHGTRLSVWHLGGQRAEALQGTENLLAVMQFFEDTYGPYPYGDHAGTVSADWGGGDFGGMEHHPYWHVSSGSLYSEEVNAHEAAHGWYGNGVRIACWEDFVLSEGIVTYMAARALGESGVDVWPSYECDLKFYCTSDEANTIALPPTCGEIDLLNHPLWSGVPYMKGAFFMRDVAELVGAEALDESLAAFFAAHVEAAANMDDFIAALEADHPDDAAAIGELADGWLRGLECPIATGPLCD